MPEQVKIEQTDFDKYIRDADLKALSEYKKGSASAPIIYKQDGALTQVEDATQSFIFVASEESQDRLGDVIKADGWQLANFKKNPVFLYAHDQNIPPIGNVPKIWVDARQLMAAVQFDSEDDFARQVKGKYQRKFMKAVSVGFRALDYEERAMDPTGPDIGGGIYNYIGFAFTQNLFNRAHIGNFNVPVSEGQDFNALQHPT